MGKLRFMQVSDLHIGKKLRERPLDEDQAHILHQIVMAAKENKVDGLIVAGDVFDDGSVPTAESMRIFDRFLNELADNEVETYIISGNHDSMSRLAFAKSFMATRGIHIVSSPEEGIVTYSKHSDGLTVDICMLPFVKPAHVRRMYPDEEIRDYNDAVRAVIAHSEFEPGKRFRILVTHQFVTASGIPPERSDSEKVIVGNTENVDASLFDMFDYVALGHIHKAQDVGSERIHYCGTPLKYSKSEWRDQKGATIIDIDSDGFTKHRIPLVPLRDVRVVEGPLQGIIDAAKGDPGSGDYVYVKLTDSPMNAMARLREVFPMVVSLETPEFGTEHLDEDLDVEGEIDEVGLFCEFYRKCTDKELTEGQKKIVGEMLLEESE